MDLGDERKQWLKEQLDKFSECQLFNFGSNDGFDIHSDVVDLLAENERLDKRCQLLQGTRNQLEAENKALLKDIQAWRRVRGKLTAENEALKIELRGERERLLLEMYNNDTISQVQFDHAMKELSLLAGREMP